MRRTFLPIFAFVVGLVGLCIAAFVVLAPKQEVGTSSVGGPFTLTNQDGQRVTERDYAGRTHLVFFGFTHCPDICPTTLGELSVLLADLGPSPTTFRSCWSAETPSATRPRC